ncbi:MAG: murein biosynthesis integral membrane protein MurJ [Actinobacteria bacterium]|nr:murein biosynthesis integral membrane protein MurJ [Actinomycetota bacterium]
MNKLLDKTRQFIFAKQKSIFSSAVILSVMIIVSSFFGFLRFRILSGLYAKGDLDIFLASFKIPDLIFEILVTGALTSSLIPIFIKYQGNQKQLDENISSIFNLILVLMSFFIVILLIFLDKIIPIITPGFSETKIQAIIFYSRLLLIGQLPLLIIGNFFTGIGQANKTFLLPALSPVVYNIAIIIGAVTLNSSFHLLAPIIGVIIGAFLFVIVQLPILYKSYFNYSLIIKKTTGLVDFFRVIVPRGLTVVVAQIDATFDLVLTSLLGTGAYTVFYFAQRLQLLPVSVIGVAFGQASLPYLSEIYQSGRHDEYNKIVVDSILSLFFFIVPIMSFLIFARTPIVRLFYGGQKFDWDATVSTAITLSYFSLALPFHSIYYFLTRCFYSFLDTKTPFIVSVLTTILNTALSLTFVFILKMPVWWLAISFSISMIINVVVLLYLLSKKIEGFDFKTLFVESTKMVVATLISSIVAYYLIKLLDGLIFDTSYTINVFLLLVTSVCVYFSIYIFLAWFFNIREIYLVTKLILKAREYRKKVLEFYTSYE